MQKLPPHFYVPLSPQQYNWSYLNRTLSGNEEKEETRKKWFGGEIESDIISLGKMRNQPEIKIFQRKSSFKALQILVKPDSQSEILETASKFLLPKNVKGLDSSLYKKDESLVRGLQEQVNKLRQQVASLNLQKASLILENSRLKEEQMAMQQELMEKNEQLTKSGSEHLSTVDALNQLKQKIDSLSDQQLSTVDEMEMQEICQCQMYQQEVESLKEKLRFVQESLLHSEEIILRLQEEMKRVKSSKVSMPLKEIEGKGNVKLSKSGHRLKARASYRLGSIEQIEEVNED